MYGKRYRAVKKVPCDNCGGLGYVKRRKLLVDKKYSWMYVPCSYCNFEKVIHLTRFDDI